MIYSDSTSYREILDRMLNGTDQETNEKFIPDTVDKREGSVIHTALAPVAMALYEMYVMMDVVMDSTFVDTASLYFLIYRAKERGVAYKEPTAAQMVGRFIPAGVVQTGDMFTANGVVYALEDSEPFAAQSGKEWWHLIAKTKGEAGNASDGDTLLPKQRIEGLSGAVIDLSKDPDEVVKGEDGDTAETLRARFYNAVENTAFGGNRADYEKKVLEQDGVGAVRIVPDDTGEISVYILGENGAAATDATVAAVQTAIDPANKSGYGYGLAPIGHRVEIKKAGAFTVNVSATVVYKQGQAAAEQTLKDAIVAYIKNLAAGFGDGDVAPVRQSGIEFSMIETGVLKDIRNVKINNSASPVTVPSLKIPVAGTITLTEAEA